MFYWKGIIIRSRICLEVLDISVTCRSQPIHITYIKARKFSSLNCVHSSLKYNRGKVSVSKHYFRNVIISMPASTNYCFNSRIMLMEFYHDIYAPLNAYLKHISIFVNIRWRKLYHCSTSIVKFTLYTKTLGYPPEPDITARDLFLEWWHGHVQKWNIVSKKG